VSKTRGVDGRKEGLKKEGGRREGEMNGRVNCFASSSSSSSSVAMKMKRGEHDENKDVGRVTLVSVLYGIQ